MAVLPANAYDILTLVCSTGSRDKQIHAINAYEHTLNRELAMPLRHKFLANTRQGKHGKRKRSPPNERFHRLGFEVLELRQLLAINYVNVANSLDSQLQTMQGRLTSALNAVTTGATSVVPLVGNKLGGAAQIVSK